MEAIDHDSKTAFQVYLKNCDERNWAHSCHKVAGYRDGGLREQNGFILMDTELKKSVMVFCCFLS